MPTRSPRKKNSANERHRHGPPWKRSPPASSGFDEITGGGLPRGPADAGLRRPGLRQDAVRPRVPDPRRGARRAGRLRDLRGDRSRTSSRTSRSLGYDLADARSGASAWRSSTSGSSARRSRRPANTISKALFIRLDHALRSIGASRIVLDTIESLFAGLEQHRRAARRAAAAVRVAEGARHHRGDHRRARHRHADAAGAGRVRLRLRHLPGSSRHTSRSRRAGCAS